MLFIQYKIGGVILIGGQSGNIILDTLYKLTSISGTWTLMNTKLKVPRRNFASWAVSRNMFTDCLPGVRFFCLLLYSVFVLG